MGSKKWTEVYFSKRLKDERDRRGWTQAELAKLLSDKLNASMHWTTIAKIEKGERSVRIDEAAGIADLFDTSVDSLLGRKAKGAINDDLAYAIRTLKDTARDAFMQLSALGGSLQDRFRDLSGFEFEGRETIYADGARAGDALEALMTALMSIGGFESPPEATVLSPLERFANLYPAEDDR